MPNWRSAFLKFPILQLGVFFLICSSALAWEGPNFWNYSDHDILPEAGFFLSRTFSVPYEKEFKFDAYKDDQLKQRIECSIPHKSEAVTFTLGCGAELFSIQGMDNRKGGTDATITVVGVSRAGKLAFEISTKGGRLWVSSKTFKQTTYSDYLKTAEPLLPGPDSAAASPTKDPAFLQLKKDPDDASQNVISPCRKYSISHWSGSPNEFLKGSWIKVACTRNAYDCRTPAVVNACKSGVGQEQAYESGEVCNAEILKKIKASPECPFFFTRWRTAAGKVLFIPRYEYEPESPTYSFGVDNELKAYEALVKMLSEEDLGKKVSLFLEFVKTPIDLEGFDSAIVTPAVESLNQLSDKRSTFMTDIRGKCVVGADQGPELLQSKILLLTLLRAEKASEAISFCYPDSSWKNDSFVSQIITLTQNEAAIAKGKKQGPAFIQILLKRLGTMPDRAQILGKLLARSSDHSSATIAAKGHAGQKQLMNSDWRESLEVIPREVWLDQSFIKEIINSPVMEDLPEKLRTDVDFFRKIAKINDSYLLIGASGKTFADPTVIRKLNAEGFAFQGLTYDRQQQKSVPTSQGDASENLACMRDASMDSNPENTKIRREKFIKGCTAEHPNCCMRAAFNEKNSGNIQDAKKYFKLACEKADQDSCRHLGNIFKYEEKDLAGAKAFYKRACDLGDKNSCNESTGP